MVWQEKRLNMVQKQLASRDIRCKTVLRAMTIVPRHLFVPPDQRPHAYADCPLPLGPGQTISQPYIVAYMSQALELAPGSRVLEVGTGSGYQAAVLAEMGMRVWSIEIDPRMSRTARRAISATGYDEVQLRVGDGWLGWPEEAPFDAILLTAAPAVIPPDLTGQLVNGGRLIMPVGDIRQELILLQRQGEQLMRTALISVSFVPMRGMAQHDR
ncbi:MAG: protein-L-isoaspartate(D-aspartate) O-methyltransferase [bacterium]|nr:protein-L-isoaspartate(D-aspartate) O-methyltransferase [bacterium]